MISRRRLVLAALVSALVAPRARAADPAFAQWLGALRKDAAAQGIGSATLDRALAGLAPLPRVIELDRRQPETTLSFDDYLARTVTAQRRETARARLAENRDLLEAIARRYGVPPPIIVALWGIETDFGRSTGGFPVIAALATLAYDGRRAAFFRRELIDALLIVDRQHIDPHRMTGSWAGAMGQSQFMPSSFLSFAVSYRGEGAPDIWDRRDDVFASMANFLARQGWHGGAPWGVSVSVPADLAAPSDQRLPVAAWEALGVRRVAGELPAAAAAPAGLLEPMGRGGPAYLVFDNFRALLRWNNSSYFGLAVGCLADSMAPR